jgi:hypothetical protein
MTFIGTVSRDFLLLVFFMNQFPPAPEYPIRTVSNFLEQLVSGKDYALHTYKHSSQE